MKTELIKTAVRVGNSAGVLLPKEYLNSEVKIVLQPLNIEKEVLNILMGGKLLKNVLGIYLVGSYARNEQTIESDIDVLVITNNISKRIVMGKYDISCISKENLEKQLENNVLPLLPMIKEAKPIINKDLIEDYKNTKLTKKNLKWQIETTNSAMNVIKSDIKISRELKEGNMSDHLVYSLILRLRTLYILDCLRKDKKWTKKGLVNLIKKISGSLMAYERYLSSKNKKSAGYKLPIDEAEKLMDYISKEVRG